MDLLGRVATLGDVDIPVLDRAQRDLWAWVASIEDPADQREALKQAQRRVELMLDALRNWRDTVV